jgi:hypothetical protein
MKVKSREEFFRSLAKIRMQRMSPESANNLIEEYGLENDGSLNSLGMTLQEMYSGITNGFLSDVYELLHGELYEFEGELADSYKCRCCGYKTLDEIYDSELGTGYDICPRCGWEDDGTENLDQRSGVNKGTISDYRKKMGVNHNFYYREKYQK